MNQQKKALLVKFFTVLSLIVGSFCILLSGVVFAYIITNPSQKVITPTVDITGINSSNMVVKAAAVEEEDSSDGNLLENLFKAPTRTNFILIGVDQSETLADVIIVGCFNSETKKIDLISIPRDTYVKIPSDRVNELKKAGFNNVPDNGVMKLNAVHSYAGKKLGALYTQKQVEELLGVTLDFYVEVNLSAFRKIVDGIGGVRMDIPKGGLYYNDPLQNLSINIPEGSQLLDGKKAEGLVRYRSGYARADLQRIEVQQKFIKELFKQAIAKENIMKNAPALISTFVSYVKTDFKISELPKYLSFLDDLSADNIEMSTLPGSSEKSAYYNVDIIEAAKLVESIFYSDTEVEQ